MNDMMNELWNSWSVIVPVVVAIFELLGLASAWHAISKVRTSQGAVAWAVGLVTLPIMVLPLYWVFGRSRFSGYRSAIRLVEQQHKSSVDAARHELFTEFNAGDPTALTPLAQLADILDTPMSYGNQFKLLVDGAAFFEKLLEQIASAERYVYAQFYILRDDDVGNRFTAALCERARAGCIVRLLYDEIGCFGLSVSYLQKLRAAGVDVQAFNTRQGWINRFQLNFRNHRKLLVVDGHRAIVGGLNVGDEYLGIIKWASRWRDTGLFINGPITRKLQAVFAGDYYWATRSDLPEAVWSCDIENTEENSHPIKQENDDGAAAVCATGPSDRRARATMMFAAAAGSSKKRLWISSPYLVPDETCINALSMARARGVDVRIILPSQPDQWLVHLASFYYENLFESIDIAVYRYKDGFLHQKCVLVDDQLVLIGSTNLDNRSLHLNFELMVAADNPELIQQATQMLEQDFANSKRKDPGVNRLLPWYVRIGTVIARLFSPVL